MTKRVQRGRDEGRESHNKTEKQLLRGKRRSNSIHEETGDENVEKEKYAR